MKVDLFYSGRMLVRKAPDAEPGLVRRLTGTVAKVAEINAVHKLLHGEEEAAIYVICTPDTSS